MNIKNNQLSKELVNKNDKAFNYAHNIFKSNENKIEVDYISSMNNAKKSRKQLKLRIA